MHVNVWNFYFNKTKAMFNLIKGFPVGLTFYKFRVLKGTLREVVGFHFFFFFFQWQSEAHSFQMNSCWFLAGISQKL